MNRHCPKYRHICRAVALCSAVCLVCFAPVRAQIDLDSAQVKTIAKDTTAAAELLSGMRYRLINGNQPGARSDLDELAAVYPDFHTAERMLLDARWNLAAGDTAAFEQGYWDVLEHSVADGNFSALNEDVSPIFTPAEAQQWENLKSPESKAAVLTRFWRSRDPDPISLSNPRLITHYVRLMEAQKNYSHPVYGGPGSSRNHGGEPERFDPTASLVDFPYEQPRPELKRPSYYELDPRGLMYLRHGPPTRTVQGSADNGDAESETWYYGNASFTFASTQGSGNFVAVPGGGTANLDQAMESESVLAEQEEKYQQYFAAEFRGASDTVVIEFYQSLPADTLDSPDKPTAVVAMFDTTWQEVALSQTESKKFEVDGKELWIGVNSLSVRPGTYYYAMRMDVAPRHPVIRKSMKVQAFTNDSLNLSGIIFGSPLDEDKTLANRSQTDLLPRPSLLFSTGEPVSVYYEIYGLKRGRDGSRKYREMITVSMAGAEENKDSNSFSGTAERLKRWTENRSNSRTLTFDREAEKDQTIIGEHFVVDTSDIEPGSYQLQLQVKDGVSGETRDVTWFFDLSKLPAVDYQSQF